MLQVKFFSLRKETLKPRRPPHTTLNTHLSLAVHISTPRITEPRSFLYVTLNFIKVR